MTEKPVYSTNPAYCPACGGTPCRCGSKAPGKSSPQPEPVRVSFIRGARGSGVTRVERLHLSRSMKEALLGRWKKRLACGGALKEGALEIQGDHRDHIEADLAAEGYKVKRTGG